MCGIAGFSLAPNERCYPTRLAAVMLKAIEHRGPHATGAAWVDPKTGQVWVHKDALTASSFIKHLDLRGGRTAILHTRWATKGDPSNNDNNHPIDVTGVVGVHNGQIANDDAIFEALGARAKREAQVDSEAIFAALKAEREAEAFTVLTTLKGTAAVAWFDVDTDGFNHSRTLHLARVKGSPLWIGTTPKGSTVFASTLGAIKAAAEEMNTTLTYRHEVEEGTYLRVRLGTVSKWDAIPGILPTVKPKLHVAPVRDRLTLRPPFNRRDSWVDDELARMTGWQGEADVDDDEALDTFLDDAFEADEGAPPMPDANAPWVEWDEWVEANDAYLRAREAKP